MSGLNYMTLGSTLSNIFNTTQLDHTIKCHYAFKNFWGEPCIYLNKSWTLHHTILSINDHDTVSFQKQFNSLPNDNYLDRTNFKAFLDDKLNNARIMISYFIG